MAGFILLVCAVLLVGVQSRFIVYEIPDNEFENLYQDYSIDEYSGRVRRDVNGVISTNADGAAFLNAKTKLASSDRNVLSAIAGVDALTDKGKYASAMGGVTLENINGHALTATAKHIPGLGDQLTGAAKVNLINNEKHNLDINTFLTKTKPANPLIPDFKTHGANIDYLYNDKLGATLSAAKTPFLQRTDVSAMGNLNVFRNPSSSIDLNAGYSKTFSPFIPKSQWRPSFSASYSRFF